MQDEVEKLQEEIKDRNRRIIELQDENRMLDKTLEIYNKQIEIYEMVIKKLCSENDTE